MFDLIEFNAGLDPKKVHPKSQPVHVIFQSNSSALIHANGFKTCVPIKKGTILNGYESPRGSDGLSIQHNPRIQVGGGVLLIHTLGPFKFIIADKVSFKPFLHSHCDSLESNFSRARVSKNPMDL